MERQRRSTALLLVYLVGVATILIPVAYLGYVTFNANASSTYFGKRVCAFYYMWYGNQSVYFGEQFGLDAGSSATVRMWNDNEPLNLWDLWTSEHPTMGTPSITLFDSFAPATLQYHLTLAHSMRINTLISSWWGPETRFDYGFQQMLNHTGILGFDEMQHSVYFESAQDARYGESVADGVTNLYSDLKYIVDTYGTNEHFLKIPDTQTGALRPVIFIYNYLSAPSLANWSSAIARLHANNIYPFLVVDIDDESVIPENVFNLFDGFHAYNPYGLILDGDDAHYNETFTLQATYAKMNKKLSCATVVPGFNNTGLPNFNDPILPRQNGAIYHQMWASAVATGADWIVITSFNEWGEGSEIETSLEFGTLYVDLTKTWTAKFYA